MALYDYCYVSVNALHDYCMNQKDKSVTPNDFFRLPMETIVRCKDCKHGERYIGEGVVCDGVWHSADWFCADGECRGKQDAID